LDPNHLRKFCRIDSWQAKSLGKNSGNRQPKHKIIGRGKQRHGFVQCLQLAYVPGAVALGRAQEIPAMRGWNDKDGCFRRFDIKAPSS